MKFAKVAVNLPAKNIFRLFTYRVPKHLDFIAVGWRVVVPFGKQLLEGFVLDEECAPQQDLELRDIADTLGTEAWFDDHMLTVARWMASYYMCSLTEVLRLFIPGKKSIAAVARYVAHPDYEGALTEWEQELYTLLLQKGPMLRQEIAVLDRGQEALKGLVAKKAVVLDFEIKAKLKDRLVNVYTITKAGRSALNEDNKRLRVQLAALAIASKTDKLTLAAFVDKGVSAATVRTLCSKLWLHKETQRVFRDSYKEHHETKEMLQLTSEQQQAVDAVEHCLAAKEHHTFLLQGITGSGKTEVYLRLAQQVVGRGQQVIVLVPEIALTGQIVGRFKAWFGNRVAVAHSKLSPSERADVWQKMRLQEADILIGVRSAIFAPMVSLGLIIIDEEHEYTYKQEERPNYHARSVARYRAQLMGIPLLLGSATPDLVSYYRAKSGEYSYLQLTHRPMAGSHLPEVKIADMRTELQEGNKTVLSRALQEAIKTTIGQDEQAIVLLNRRGYSTFVMCRDCGYTVTCPNCAVAQVYHSSEKTMRCHYCGHTTPIPDECPVCHSRRIKFFGTGTEKAEKEIQALSLEVKPIRMDQDSTANKFAHEMILKNFATGNSNVLLGTQMVAKGHDIPNVTLVGVLSADSQLNIPDFRAGERTFSLLTQAAGRAGRGAKKGHVIFQAYEADSPILLQAATQDYEGFATQELDNRKELGYPPFNDLLKITVHDKDQDKGNALAQRVVNYLQGELLLENDSQTQVMGPFPAVVAMVMHVYRINILIKSVNMPHIKQLLWHSEFKELNNVYFDVDPVSVI